MHLYIFVFISLTHCTFGLSFTGILRDLHYCSFSLLFESCDKRWITENIHDLENDLDRHVFGQNLASDTILGALQSHSTRTHRKKPLVLNFHGWPGGGKGYIADFIVKRWFKKGDESKFVKKYRAKIDFPLKSEVYVYQRRLQNELEATIRKCRKAMFVFDEVDKYPPHVLDGIKPYLDYNTQVNGYDFREAIFIFITNNGDKQITNIALQKRAEGISREELKLRDFDHVLRAESFNDEGGFYQSDLIRHHLIDHVVPFLPLEREHVASCITAEMIIQHYSDPGLIGQAISEILEEMTFGPPDDDLYSINGCKHVSEKVGFILERERRKRNIRHSEF